MSEAPNGQLIGYGRVSHVSQNLSTQIEALQKYGCHKIFKEKITGVTSDRPELDKLLKYIRTGDTVVVTRVDRLGRSLKTCMKILSDLKEQGINLIVIDQCIDTRTKMGNFFFQILSLFSELEYEFIREKTSAGRALARKRGIIGGRRPKLDKSEINLLGGLAEKGIAIESICKRFNISQRSYHRYLKLYIAKLEEE